MRRLLGSAYDELPIGATIVAALVIALALFKLQGLIPLSWWWIGVLALLIPALGLLVLLIAVVVTWVERRK